MPPLRLTAQDVAAAVGGRVAAGTPSLPIERISIDTRTLAAGDFFIAIRGERVDGHAYVPQAIAAGAAGVLVSDAFAVQSIKDAVVVSAPDTTRALQDLASHVRQRSGTTVVAITGSAGKTTTKEICAEFLSARYRVFKNKGNLNNHIGLPLSLLELRSGPDVAVVELGMNHPGEIRALVGIAAPEVRVWTNVGDAHLGFFSSPDAVADAKAEILERASAADLLVANGDDPRIVERASAFAGSCMTFGVDRRADVRARDVALSGLDGIRAIVETRVGSFQLDTPLLGAGNLHNVLAATAVAIHFEVPLPEIEARARGLRPAPHRGELLRLPGGITLIDDSYNSSPSALKQSLEIVAASRGSARKVVVLGEMLELGDHARRLHGECGRSVATAAVDLLIAVGSDPARVLADEAIAGGMARERVVPVGDREAAAEEALKRVRPGDLVLVKGSRGIGLDILVERLKAEFA